MTLIGSILCVIGLVIWLAGEVRFLAIAYRRNLAWFLGCLFIPFVAWLFILLNLRQTWKPTATAIVGFVIAVTGYLMGGLQALD